MSMGMVALWSEVAVALLLTLMAVPNFPATVSGAVYKVGDAATWKVGGVDYRQWASNKTFHVGDTITFEYDPHVHNVLRVSHEDYGSCNTTSPIATFLSGNDSIKILGPGHYYYVCGFEGHCRAGQKVDIRVPKVNQPTGLSNGPQAESPHGPSPSPTNGLSQHGPPRSSDTTHSPIHLGPLHDLVFLLLGLSNFII